MFNLATTLLADPAHLAGFKRESNYEEVSAFLEECKAEFPKCPKWASLTAALDKDSGKWVSGGALKCAREIRAILTKKSAARAEAKAKVITNPIDGGLSADIAAQETEMDTDEMSRQIATNPASVEVEVPEEEEAPAEEEAPKAAPKARKAAPKAKAKAKARK